MGHHQSKPVMKPRTLLSVVLVLSISLNQAVAQATQSGLYMPREFQEAYAKGTRKFDGTLSASYWQNKSEYKLKATVDPYTKLLTGEGEINYHNNSPDTLSYIVFHTYADYYREDARHEGFFNAEFAGGNVTEGFVITSLRVGGDSINLDDRKTVNFRGTNYRVTLSRPLDPGGSLHMAINWHYTIPGRGFERSGAIDSTSMFIGYWYPEMSVYDDVDGWDRIVYDAATEFYHDYSSYDVEVVAPSNFMVWASVAPTNPQEVYSKDIQKRIDKAHKSTAPVEILTAADLDQKMSTVMKHWKYQVKDFPDFSFALSDHFLWHGCYYSDKFGEYLMHAVFPADHESFAAVLPAEIEALKVFHGQFPTMGFPFHYFTVFNGNRGGGMEFAGMTNNSEVNMERLNRFMHKEIDPVAANQSLTIHEMCHEYFPFMMGIHEKKYAWMDEGMASYSEFFITDIFHDIRTPRNRQDYSDLTTLPMMVPTYQNLDPNSNSYDIASRSYYSLNQLLGDETFDKCMQTYMQTWQHHHPTPYDFMFIINTVSGKDLNWFWKRWYFDWAYVDLGIKDFKDGKVTVENLGGRPMAANVVAMLADSTTVTAKVNPQVWQSSTSQQITIDSKGQKVLSVSLEVPDTGDAVADNDTWTAE